MAKSTKTDKKVNTTDVLLEAVFQIRGIELIRYNLSDIADENINEFRFEFQIQQQIQQKEKIVIATISVGVRDTNDTSLGHLNFRCIFEVENLIDLIKNKEALQAFGTKLNKIAVGTARGLMFGLFRGTPLHNAVLPIVDAQNFMV